MLSLLLFAALAPLSPARADNHQPWNQPGSAWQGTIDTSIYVADHNEQGGYTRDVPTANYSDLVPLDGTANENYAAAISTSGHEQYSGTCSNVERPYNDRIDWTATVPRNDAVVLRLRTDDSGRSYFTPATVQSWDGTYTSTCTEDGQPSQSQHIVSGTYIHFGLQFFQEDSESPLPDSDPDPLHLVGTRTWTVGDWPITPDNPPDEYSFTVTYDLRLVTDECLNSNVTHDIYEAGVDAGEFELRTVWCTTKAGDIRVTDATAIGRHLDSPMQAVLAAEFEIFLNASAKWRPEIVDQTHVGGETVVTGTGKLRECFGIPLPLKTKYLRKLSDVFLRISVEADNRAVRKAAIVVADLLDKAANRLAQGSEWLANKVLNALLDMLSPLPERVGDKLADLLIFVISDWKNSPEWARDAVMKGVIARDIAIKKIIKNEYCLTAWKPRIVHTLHADNTAVSEYVDLDGDYDSWKVVRTGGSG